MSENPHSLACPSGDNSTSSTGNHGPMVYSPPQGDLNTSSGAGTSEVSQHYVGCADGILNKAGAFYNEDYNGIQEPSPERDVDGLHVNLVASRATKDLNRKLMDAIELSIPNRQQVQKVRDRVAACRKILEMWMSWDRRSIQNLIDLLEQIEASDVANAIRATQL